MFPENKRFQRSEGDSVEEKNITIPFIYLQLLPFRMLTIYNSGDQSGTFM